MTLNSLLRWSCVLVLAAAFACSSGGGGTTDPGTTVTDTGAETVADVPVADVPAGNGCFPCLVAGKTFRFDSIADDKQNLLIFVTATILSELGENLVPIAPEPPAGK